MNDKKDNIWGLVSFILVIFALAWSISINRICLGDYVLKFFGLPVSSSSNTGVHYTPYYSIPILATAVIIAKKHLTGFFAKASMILACILLLFFILSVFSLV